MGSSACLSAGAGPPGEETMWEPTEGKGLEWARPVKVAMPLCRELCSCPSQLPNMPPWFGSQCDASFLEAQFCRVGPDPRMGAVGRRLTALAWLWHLAVCYPNVPQRYDATASRQWTTQPIGVLVPHPYFLPTNRLECPKLPR